ncbi:hypothetical protein ACHAQA_004587 [Verticillium albo-atrum]
MTFSSEGMPPDVLAEVLDRIGALLSHVSYTVRGLAALSVYGFPCRLPSHVSIACPHYARDVIKCWAAAQGMVVLPFVSDAFGVPLPDGSIRRVRLEFVDGEVPFDWVAMGPSGTRIASMPSLLDALARKYVEIGSPVRAVGVLGRDIAWLLQRIVEDGTPEQRLTAERVPNVASGDFWSLYTFTHPGMDEMFHHAGFVPPHSPPKESLEADIVDWFPDDTMLENLSDLEEPSPSAAVERVKPPSRHMSVRTIPPLRRKRSLYFRDPTNDHPATVELTFVGSPTRTCSKCQSPWRDEEVNQADERDIFFYPLQKENW